MERHSLTNRDGSRYDPNQPRSDTPQPPTWVDRNNRPIDPNKNKPKPITYATRDGKIIDNQGNILQVNTAPNQRRILSPLVSGLIRGIGQKTVNTVREKHERFINSHTISIDAPKYEEEPSYDEMINRIESASQQGGQDTDAMRWLAIYRAGIVTSLLKELGPIKKGVNFHDLSLYLAERNLVKDHLLQNDPDMRNDLKKRMANQIEKTLKETSRIREENSDPNQTTDEPDFGYQRQLDEDIIRQMEQNGLKKLRNIGLVLVVLAGCGSLYFAGQSFSNNQTPIPAPVGPLPTQTSVPKTEPTATTITTSTETPVPEIPKTTTGGFIACDPMAPGWNGVKAQAGDKVSCGFPSAKCNIDTNNPVWVAQEVKSGETQCYPIDERGNRINVKVNNIKTLLTPTPTKKHK